MSVIRGLMACAVRPGSASYDSGGAASGEVSALAVFNGKLYEGEGEAYATNQATIRVYGTG